MSINNPRGLVYHCPVCGAEVAVLARRSGEFAPRCCNKDMVLQKRRLAFHVCPVCGAEITVLNEGAGNFTPRCCNRPMVLEAA